jgi:Protein of unknown function (DUF3304)
MSSSKKVAVQLCAGSSAGRRLALLVAAVWTLVGCGQLAAQDKSAEPQALAQSTGKPIGLAINGFNYTDIAIDLFSVAHQGGGNILVSSPTSGGGGTVCCLTWRPGTKLPKPILVEWMRYANKKQRWCQKTVMLTGPVPANPTAIGVHFMPDGDIQLAITEGESDPKLKLQRFSPGSRKETGNVIHDEETASCKDGY